MDTLTRLLVISLVGSACSAGNRREYASAGASQPPLMFAAVPLHAPVPVLHVLSPAPLHPLAHRQPLAAAADLAPDETAPVPRYGTKTAGSKQRLRPPAYHEDYDESYAPASNEAASLPRYKIAATKQRLRLTAYRETPDYEASFEYTRPTRARYEDEYESYASQPVYSTAHQYSPSYVTQPAYSAYSGSHLQPAAYSSSQLYSTSHVAQPVYASPHTQPARPAYSSYEAVYAGSAEAAPGAAPAVLYARPRPSGGYTYRRAAPRQATPQPPAKPSKESPYILRIHKHRVVKDRSFTVDKRR